MSQTVTIGALIAAMAVSFFWEAGHVVSANPPAALMEIVE